MRPERVVETELLVQGKGTGVSPRDFSWSLAQSHFTSPPYRGKQALGKTQDQNKSSGAVLHFLTIVNFIEMFGDIVIILVNCEKY